MYETNPWTMAAATCGLLFLVVGLPLSIWFGSRQKRGPHAGDVIHRAGKRARNPWEQETASLHELSDRVRSIRADTATSELPSSDQGLPGAGSTERKEN